MVQGGTRVSLVQLLITPEGKKVAHDRHGVVRRRFYTINSQDAHVFHEVPLCHPPRAVFLSSKNSTFTI